MIGLESHGMAVRRVVDKGVAGIAGGAAAGGVAVTVGIVVAAAAGPVVGELATAGLPNICPAHDIASVERATANKVAQTYFNMVFPFQSGDWFLSRCGTTPRH